jgi:hypothetical protein
MASLGRLPTGSAQFVAARAGDGDPFALNKAVREVFEGQSGKDILLIGGQADALPMDAPTFRRWVHETAIVGVIAG